MEPSRKYILLTLLMLFLAIGWSCRGAFVDQRDAVRALQGEGYGAIRITDRAWFVVGLRGCSSEDAARFTAIAKTSGEQIELYACSGWPIKGITIRMK